MMLCGCEDGGCGCNDHWGSRSGYGGSGDDDNGHNHNHIYQDYVNRLVYLIFGSVKGNNNPNKNGDNDGDEDIHWHP